MDTTKCEFCNAYITNSEVHNCVKFGNRHRRNSAPLPQRGYGNVAEDIELIKAEEMEDEALWPFVRQSNSSTLNQINRPLNQINQPLNQINNSRQQSISSDIHQLIDYKESAVAEMVSQYGDGNQNSYKRSDYETETSDCLFPDLHYIQEIDLMSTHLQLPPEVSNAFMNQNPQNFESSSSEHAENPPMSVATLCVLPGFQQTFDRRNSISNTALPSASSVNCEQISEDKSLERTSYAFKDMDAPQKPKNPLHKCSKCPVVFRRKDYLESHERVHNVEKPYVCNFCDKTFPQSGALGAHIRTHTGEKPYQCNQCDKCFAGNSDLRRHVRIIHTGEKPYACNQCGKCFAVSGNLSRHVSNIHTGEKPYACNKCNKRYFQNFDLKRHMRKHAGEERSKCDSCGDEFSSEESLGAHKCRKSK